MYAVDGIRELELEMYVEFLVSHCRVTVEGGSATLKCLPSRYMSWGLNYICALNGNGAFLTF